MELCSGDMLLEALVACAGVTLKAVSTALEFRCGLRPWRRGVTWISEARWASQRMPPVGFAQVRLRFEVDTDAPQEKLDQLLKLTERYCVVYQTIKSGPPVEVTLARASSRGYALPANE